ncbi:MAG: hypothetical protein Q9181_006930 [Wetmoreana brouardii]
MLTLIRKTVLLLDSALVSYVRSHSWVSGYEKLYYDLDMESFELGSFELSHGDDPLGYRYSRAKLACLDAFLENREVGVFQVFNKHSTSHPKPQRSVTKFKSVLARMKDLADIWGPVYTVPSESGLIKFYGVSKGVICRVDAKSECSIPGAVECHYFTRSSFFMRKASKLLLGAKDLLLAVDDLLLIGARLRENRSCKYRISEFSQDWASEIGVLGTHESVWKTDTRSLTLGISKYLGVTVSGSQKLIPETTRKQHVLDKWTTIPTRANPGILNQYLGVEVSHCTGNARRISLRDLMTRAPILAILERQIPGWTQTPWGSSLSMALLCEAGDAIFHVWKDFVSNRPQIAELFCCVLELLDCTGWDEHGKFHAALLYNDEESAVSIPSKINDWMAALRDTHLTSAYVMINEVCLDCAVPDHSTSACHIPQALTVLQTQLATLSPERDKEASDLYILKPFGLPLKKWDFCSSEINLFKPTSRFPMDIPWSRAKSRECIEILNYIPDSTTNAVYLAASARSFHGLHRRRSSMPSHHAESVSTSTSLNNKPVQARTQQSQKRRGKDHEYSRVGMLALRRTPCIVDDDGDELIESDILGQEFYTFANGNNGLVDDMTNYILDDNDDDNPDHDFQTSKQENGQPVQPKQPSKRK